MMRTDDYAKAVEFAGPGHIPSKVKLMPGTWRRYREELERLVLRHRRLWPEFVEGSVDFDSTPYQEGNYTDEWGCGWTNITDGLNGLVVGHPLADWKDFESYVPPVPDRDIAHGFMLLRLCDLRGFENLMLDFADEPPQLQKLIDMVLDYNVAVVKNLLADEPWLIGLGEDLGMQDRLLLSPAYWEKYILPCYAKIVGLARQRGVHVYLHCDGHILEIADDLIECGVTIINPQIRANTLGGIEKAFKGRICIDLDLDRQLFPFCGPKEIEEHIAEAVMRLGSKEGGLMLIAEMEPDVPIENIEAVCAAMEKYMDYMFD